MSKLFEPVTFRCGATARNAVALASLTNQQSHADGTLAEDERRWLVRRAEGGFGLVETCAAHVSREGQAFDGQLGTWSDAHLPGLRTLARDVNATGALSIVQLHHGGARARPELTGEPTWSASAFTEDKPGFVPPRAATAADLERVIGDHERAATRVRDAGFGGAELHGAHGYLLGQFLSAKMNRRTDEWGGSLENRARLLRTVTRKLRALAPAPFVLGVRLSPEDFGQAYGLDLDESVQVARWLAEDGVDFVHLSLWNCSRMTTKRPAEHALPIFRAALPPEVKLIAAGNVWSRGDADAVLTRGADLVALGKAAILDPDWPKHAQAPTFEPVRGPLSPEELEALAISKTLVSYLRRFKTLVRD